MILHYLLVFSALLLLGSIIINGWFAVTRGQWRDEVDGTRVKEGALLKGWYFFWFKERREKKYTQYKGEAFLRLVDSIKKTKAFSELEISEDNSNRITANVKITSDYYRMLFKDHFDVALFYERNAEVAVGDRGYVTLHKKEPDYVFPEKLRTVMAGCITCFSSIWGSIVFWTAYLLLGDAWIRNATSCPEVLLGVTWIAYMLGLAYVNTYLWKRTNKA